MAGCDKINETQKSQIMSTINCYRTIHEQLIDSANRKQVENLRYQYFRKQQLPYFIPDKEYTMIPREYIFKILKMGRENKCRTKLDSLKDFAGIRIVNYQFISYEICRLRRNYGKYGGVITPIETHRLVYNTSKYPFKKADFMSEDERISHVEKLGDGWTYIVSTF